MPTVRVGDINIYYEDHGKGEPLLLIEGWGTDLTCWQFQIPEFSTKYRVIAFDNRGAGRTDAPDQPYSFRMMADDAVGLLDALGIGKAHILGMSMGGCIAQEIAIEHPERTRSLILAATTAAPGACPMLMNTLTAWTAAMKEGVSLEDDGQDAVAIRSHQPVLRPAGNGRVVCRHSGGESLPAADLRLPTPNGCQCHARHTRPTQADSRPDAGAGRQRRHHVAGQALRGIGGTYPGSQARCAGRRSPRVLN